MEMEARCGICRTSGSSGDRRADRLATWPTRWRLIKRNLHGRAALLGFAGSPWTLANFMLEGGSAKQFVKAREFLSATATPTNCWPGNYGRGH